MTVRLTRSSHGMLPQSSGLEVDDAGHATGWQTSGHRVGRFAHTLTAGTRAALDRALAAARQAPPTTTEPAHRPPPPSGSTEWLIADWLPEVVLEPSGPLPAEITDLVDLLVAVRAELPEHPVAVIELDAGGSPLRARLRHLGSEPLAVRWDSLTVDATLFDADSAVLDGDTRSVSSGHDGPVGPGWSLPLIDGLDIGRPADGGFLTITVGVADVDVRGDGVLRPAEFTWMTE